MNVALTPKLERLIREKVESGEYRSASEVVREALRLLVLDDERHQKKLAALRGDIQRGIDSLDTGGAAAKDEVFARVRVRRERQESSRVIKSRSSGA